MCLVNECQQELYGARSAIPVNVPTRWATNLIVLDGILRSRKALQMAADSEAWIDLPATSKADEVHLIIMSIDFWKQAELLKSLLQPFGDAIYQDEAEKPLLSDSHVVLQRLHDHVALWGKRHRTGDMSDSAKCDVTGRAFATVDRRLTAKFGCALAPAQCSYLCSICC
jgi:hypothetical protein